ncbi:MAG: hypothetical protein ABIR98_12445 [Usitatibacter sp.]
MTLRDILTQYADRSYHQPLDNAADDFERVAADAPPEILRDGLAEAFRAEETPPFPQMVAHLFGKSDGPQRAGILNEILSSLGGGALGGLAGGPLGDLVRRGGHQISPQEAQRISPEQIQETVARAERHDPGLVERASAFYANHPQLVRQLGTAVLTLAMRKMARRVH